MKIAINGFGRIGRSILRLAMERRDVEIALVNDVASLEICAYLFEYDSVFGPWRGEVRAEGGALILDGRKIPFHAQADVGAIDLSGVDVLLECAGRPHALDLARSGLAAGARRVLISGPVAGAETTLILGANEEAFRGERIVSNGSCTTNALAPLLRVVDDHFGVVGGQMTTVHCYTGAQPSVDQARSDPARSRAAALSMIPTTTSAHHLLKEVLPCLAGRIAARALRVPTASVSALDLTVVLSRPRSLQELSRTLKTACMASPVLGWIDKPLASVDLRGRSESLIVSEPELSMSGAGDLLRIFGWYDNEWAFSSRMLDMAQIISGEETGK